MSVKKIWQKYFSEKKQKQIILLYHHINNLDIDPWEMCVQPEYFKIHLEVLAENYKVLPLTSIEQNKKINSKKPVVYLTFDDGYRDNFSAAYPLLKEFNLPAAFFIPTKNFTSNQFFWWEVLEEIFLGPQKTPAMLQLEINGNKKEWILEEKKILNKKFSAWTDVAETHHQQAYTEIGEIIKHLAPAMQEDIAQQLIKWFAHPLSLNGMDKINLQQLKQIHAEGLVEIGAHTINHPALGVLDKKKQAFEIAEGKKQLEKIIETNVKSFAYPHGHYAEITKKIVSDSKFSFAVTADENSFTSDNDFFELPRIWVKNWNKETFTNNLKKWIE